MDSEAFEVAARLFQAGRLSESEQLCRQIVAADSVHAEAWHLLGLIALQTGQSTAAISYLKRAVTLNPADAEAHSNLGIALKNMGNWEEAFEHFHRALEARPSFVEALFNLANALQEQGRIDEAIAHYRQVLALGTEEPLVLNNLGNALNAQGKLEEAVACFRRALELRPDFAEAHNGLGKAFQAQGKPAEAAACFHRAVELRPNYAEAHSNLGHAFRLMGKLQDAVAACRRATALAPNIPEAHINLGAALYDQGSLDDAATCFRRAIELAPGYAEAQYNLGTALRAQGKFNEADDSYRRTLELNPDYADAHAGRGLLRLLRGDFEQGWREYEWRWKSGKLIDRNFSQPRWDGNPLGQRTILLHAEQGLGDTIQFVRYAKIVKKENPSARVVVECPMQLIKLLAKCPGIDLLVAEGSDLPPFDVHCPLLSLPGVMGTTLETVPAKIPYLFAKPALIEQWRERLASCLGFRIGINWQGRVGQSEFRWRNIPLEHFGTLAKIAGVQLVSLQKGPGQLEIMGGTHAPIMDLGEFDTAHGAFMDTAAIMMNLDLVISSDTAVPHLAGALGVPVWVALPFVPDFRWLLDRSDSPWYPTMRLFRQKNRGDWDGVFREIRESLRECFAAQRSARPL